MRRLIAASFGLMTLAACATLEPEPCTAEWVEWKTDRVLGSFARDHRGLISDLRDFSKNLEDPGPLTLLRMASKVEDFQALAEDFQGNIMPELETAVAQCGTPEKFIPAFTGFLRNEGVEDDMLVWVETLGALAISSSTRSEP